MNYYYLHKATDGLIHRPNVVLHQNHTLLTCDFIRKLWPYADGDKTKLQEIFDEAQKLGAQQGSLWQMRCLHKLKGAVTDYEFELEKSISSLELIIDRLEEEISDLQLLT